MGLQDIAEKIARAPGWYGGSQNPVDGSTTWYLRVRAEGSNAEAGKMELMEDRLTITEYGTVDMYSRNASALSEYDLVDAEFRLLREPSSIPCVVTIWGTDRITTSGKPGRLMLHWLAFALVN